MSERFFLSKDVILRRLEVPTVYHVKKDELYELDERAFQFLQECSTPEGCFTDEKEFLDYCISEGILVHSWQGPRRETIRQSPKPSLRYLELLITDRCNLRCRHCYIGEPERTDMPLEVLLKVLKELNEIQGLRLLISGGEPLLYPAFEKLNDYLKEYPLRKVLLTNGIFLTPERLRCLNFEEIQLSIDGLEEAHDYIRGPGSYRKTIKALENALSEGFDVSVSTMVHSRNLGDFEEMERFLKGLGIREWNVDVPVVQGRLRDNPELNLPPEIAGRYLGYGFGGGFHGGTEGYGCGTHLASVLPDGSVAKCSFYESISVGHVREGLRECWRRIKPIRLEELQCDCEFINLCRGGCRYRAELLTGSASGKDLFKCHAIKTSD